MALGSGEVSIVPQKPRANQMMAKDLATALSTGKTGAYTYIINVPPQIQE